jgi:hypothetical protein
MQELSVPFGYANRNSDNVGLVSHSPSLVIAAIERTVETPPQSLRTTPCKRS